MLLEMLRLKEDVEEVYGPGMFEKHIFRDISSYLGISKMGLSNKENENMQKQGTVVNKSLDKRSFADVVLRNGKKEDLSKKES